MVLPLVLALSSSLLARSHGSADPVENTVNPFYWSMSAGSTDAAAGFSWYTNIFELFKEGYPLQMQMGLGGTWLTGLDIDFGQTCACNPEGWPNNPAVAPHDQSNGCCDQAAKCGWLFETFEGGPGYWVGELPSVAPKWRAGSSVGCYRDCINSPLWCGADTVKDCGSLGMVALSNHILMAPDGISFDSMGMLGVAYVRTPFGKVDARDSRNFWTIVLDAANFAGPLAYWLPEFWAERAKGWEEQSAHLKDIGTVSGLSVGPWAFEWNTIQTYKDGQGNYKLPNMSVPQRNGQGILVMGTRGYTDSDIGVPLEAALTVGSLSVTTIMKSGSTTNCISGSSSAVFNVEGSRSIEVGTLRTRISTPSRPWTMSVAAVLVGIAAWGTMVLSICLCTGVTKKSRFGCFLYLCLLGMLSVGIVLAIKGDTGELSECLWTIELNNPQCVGLSECPLPRYLDANLQPTDAQRVSPELRDQQFPQKLGSAAYDALGSPPPGGCISAPGPASDDLYCVQTKSNSWLAWRWYRFVDQPSMARARLSAIEASYMQQRVETLHKMAPRESRWIKASAATVAEGLAEVDAALLVEPPKGFECGFVPVVLYEGMSKPLSCKSGTDEKTEVPVAEVVL